MARPAKVVFSSPVNFTALESLTPGTMFQSGNEALVRLDAAEKGQVKCVTLDGWKIRSLAKTREVIPLAASVEARFAPRKGL